MDWSGASLIVVEGSAFIAALSIEFRIIVDLYL